MTTKWTSFVEPPVNAEPVDQATEGRGFSQLVSRTDYLKERLDALSPEFGRVIIPRATLDSSTNVNDWVYFDPVTDTYKAAIAEVLFDTNVKTVTLSPRALVIGFILSKESATVGDIFRLGRNSFTLGELNGMLENSTSSPFTAGRYFLSRTLAGKMVKYPSGPSICLGVFDVNQSNIQIELKDVNESHYHYLLPMQAKPSASQNYDRTGWHDFGDGIKIVDYFNRNTDTNPPNMILCVRRNAGVAVNTTEYRVDLAKDTGGTLKVSVYAGPTYATYGSGTATSYLRAWPAYGEWIAITNTDLEVAWIRQDATYANPLSTDASALTALTDRYSIYLPNDLQGWTNANTFDTVPTDAAYRYITEADSSINYMFPPMPLTGANISVNGIDLEQETDFVVNMEGIWWFPNGYSTTQTFSPWAHDYRTDGVAMDPTLDKKLVFYSLDSDLANWNHVVSSIRSSSAAVYFRDYLSKKSAQTGPLEMVVDLAMTQASTATDSDTAFTGVSGINLTAGPHVSQLEAGPGIILEKTSGTFSGKYVGKVRVSIQDLSLAGEVQNISLINAKESIKDGFTSFVEFINPATATSGIVAKIKIPNHISGSSTINLGLHGMFFGLSSVSISAAPAQAVFKVMYHVVRPGLNVASFTEVNAAKVDYWIVPFTSGYVNYDVLADEYPIEDPNDVNALRVYPGNINPSALISALNPGDEVCVSITRLTSVPIGSDSYASSVGLATLRWDLKVT
jgi:hypothetical protein